MSAGGEFYLADEKSLGADNKVKTTENVLYFRFKKSGFDGRADREHVKNFPVDYSNFMLANPDFKNPWGEEPSPVLVGNKLLNVGDVAAEPKGGDKPSKEDAKSDDERARQDEQPKGDQLEDIDIAPKSKGSEAPKGEDALEAPVENADSAKLKKGR